MDGVEGCRACDLAAGRRDLPGGRIHETANWIVEHCVGPLGVGALLVKPARHVVSLGELNGSEAAEPRMFDRGALPPIDEVEEFAERARRMFAGAQPPD